MRSRILRGDAGFSLIEVLVVMAMIAILAGIAALSLNSFLPSLRLKRATQELQLQLQKARLEAVRRNRPCFVSFHVDVGGKRYSPLIWVDENRNAVFDNGEDVFRQQVDPGTLVLAGFGGIRFDNTQGGGDGVDFAVGTTSGLNAFRFNLRGLSDKAGSIHLLNSAGRHKTIDITFGGAIRVR